MSDSGRQMGECSHGNTGYCLPCIRELLGVKYDSDIEPAIKRLKERQVREEQIVRIARVLHRRDPVFIADDVPGSGVVVQAEPGSDVKVDDDIKFMQDRYMEHAHHDRKKIPHLDYQSADIFSVREWLARLFGVKLAETPATWIKKQQARVRAFNEQRRKDGGSYEV